MDKLSELPGKNELPTRENFGQTQATEFIG
jgi:hypothetical protein